MFKINEKIVNIERFPDGTPRIEFDFESVIYEVDSITLEWQFKNNEKLLLLFIVRKIKELKNENQVISLVLTYDNYRDIDAEEFSDFIASLNFDNIEYNVNYRYQQDNEYTLKLFKDKLKDQATRLTMPYIPHGRMDRAENINDVFTLKYFCEFVNALNFDKVLILDPHSAVTTDLLRNVEVKSIKPIVDKIFKDKAFDIVLYPDKGAYAKYTQLFDYPFAYAIKERDWDSGHLVVTDLKHDLPGEIINKENLKVLIIDDICAFGGTYLFGGKKVKELFPNWDLSLYVTHCEDSILDEEKGILIKSGLLDRIYTTNSIFTKAHELIEVVENVF